MRSTKRLPTVASECYLFGCYYRASQKLNLASPQRRKRRGDGESPAPSPFATDFCGLMRRGAPPPPPQLLRRLGTKENPGVGKVNYQSSISISIINIYHRRTISSIDHELASLFPSWLTIDYQSNYRRSWTIDWQISIKWFVVNERRSTHELVSIVNWNIDVELWTYRSFGQAWRRQVNYRLINVISILAFHARLACKRSIIHCITGHYR